jgi:hypothetical protein
MNERTKGFLSGGILKAERAMLPQIKGVMKWSAENLERN